MYLNHPEVSLPTPVCGKNCHPWNQSLAPKRLGTAALPLSRATLGALCWSHLLPGFPEWVGIQALQLVSSKHPKRILFLTDKVPMTHQFDIFEGKRSQVLGIIPRSTFQTSARYMDGRGNLWLKVQSFSISGGRKKKIRCFSCWSQYVKTHFIF